MRNKLKFRVYVGIMIAVLLVLVVAVVAYGTFQRQYREATAVKETYQVINQLVLIQKLLIDMETGHRGYRSTNESQFLEPYNQGLQELAPATQELITSTKDNPEQLKRAQLVVQQIRDMETFWKDGLNRKDYSRDDLVRLLTGEKQRMDAIRSRMAEMTESENMLLEKRLTENRKSVSFAKKELLAGLLMILLIVGVLIWLMLRELRTRKSAELKLKRSFDELTVLNQKNSERNWVLAGVSEVNDVLQGHGEISELSSEVLTIIMKYLRLHAGAFYVYDEDDKKLKLNASYAVHETAKKEYHLKEGFVGEAAAQRAPLVINSIPSNYLQVEGATLKGTPASALYIALRHQDELKGVIEVLSLGELGEQKIELMQLLTNNIAVSIQSVQARKRKLQLLTQVQQQKEILENQQEELRQTNEELTSQAEILQASEEELRVQEEELRQMNAELGQKNSDIEAAKEAVLQQSKALEETNRYKSEFLANMSHELRTPLNSILILSKLLADNNNSNLSSKQVEHATLIHKSGKDLLDLINDILDLSKIEAGKTDVNLEEVRIQTFVSNMHDLFSVIADERKIAYEIDISQVLPETIHTDAQKVEQVLKNLLSNAFKFTREGGKVTLAFGSTIRDDKDYLSVAVIDNGIGIPVNKQALIFEAFKQADNSTSRKYGGTGLGLSITKELMRLLGGKIELKSKENEGSNFTVLLPFDPAVSKTHGTAETLPAAEASVINLDNVKEQDLIADERAELADSNKTLLIVEDDRNFARVLQDFAHSQGFKTIVALRGDEALVCVQKYKPAAIILDMELPGVTGEIVLQKLKEDKALRDIPIHIVSSSDEVSLASSAGAAFLKKPVDGDQLKNAFDVISDRLKTAVANVLLVSQQTEGNEVRAIVERDMKSPPKLILVTSVEEALLKEQDTNIDCLVYEMSGDWEKDVSDLKTLNQGTRTQDIPTIIYLDEDISQTKELELKKISEVIIRKSTFSNKRLQDELERFLSKPYKDNKGFRPTHSPVFKLKSTQLKGRKVLLVDDDMRNIFSISAALEQEEMNIVTASDGKEAIDILEQDKSIDIVLIDVMMPNMDGYEAMTYIRNELKMSSLPVIAITARAMPGDKEKCIQSGASDFISKPVDISRLVTLLKLWLS